MLFFGELLFASSDYIGPLRFVAWAILLPFLTPISVYLVGSIRAHSLVPNLNPEMVWTVFSMMILYIIPVTVTDRWQLYTALSLASFLTPFVMLWTTWVAAMPGFEPPMDKGQMLVCLFGPYVVFGIFVLTEISFIPWSLFWGD